MNRREFVKYTCLLAISTIIPDWVSARNRTSSRYLDGRRGYTVAKEAMFYTCVNNNKLICRLCPRECQLSSGQEGICRVRVNKDNKLITLAYGNPCAVHIDPVEKNPLFHFMPGMRCLSVATAGCTFRCKFCQNWQISQYSSKQTVNFALMPSEVIQLACQNKCNAMNYTYSEPTVFFEYMLDIAKEAKKHGMMNICHSNGFINPEPLDKLCQYMDAINIDLKGFTEKYYYNMSKGRLAPVLQTLKILKKKKGIHLEITNTVIPGYNDNTTVVKQMCKWIKDELGDDIPLHFARFYPYYKLKHLSPTPTAILEALRNVAHKVGLKYVYIGNLPGHPGEHTYCAYCNNLLIKRFGFKIIKNFVKDSKCIYCGAGIHGIW